MAQKNTRKVAASAARAQQTAARARSFTEQPVQKSEQIKSAARQTVVRLNSMLGEVSALAAARTGQTVVGQAVTARTLHCYRCRSAISPGKKFCPRCGAKL